MGEGAGMAFGKQTAHAFALFVADRIFNVFLDFTSLIIQFAITKLSNSSFSITPHQKKSGSGSVRALPKQLLLIQKQNLDIYVLRLENDVYLRSRSHPTHCFSRNASKKEADQKSKGGERERERDKGWRGEKSGSKSKGNGKRTGEDAKVKMWEMVAGGDSKMSEADNIDMV
ncbi:hypothetical protein Tco_0352862 [Tanacetum coccineum]